MNKGLGDIEDLFKDELADLNVQPNDSLEIGVMNAIDFDKTSPKPNKGGFLPYLLIALLLGVGGCVTLLYSGKNKDRSELSTESEKEMALQNNLNDLENNGSNNFAAEIHNENNRASTSLINILPDNDAHDDDDQTSHHSITATFHQIGKSQTNGISPNKNDSITASDKGAIMSEIVLKNQDSAERHTETLKGTSELGKTLFNQTFKKSIARVNETTINYTDQFPSLTLDEASIETGSFENFHIWRIDSILPSNMNSLVAPLFKKHTLSIGGFYSLPQTNRFNLNSSNTNWLADRRPTQQFFVNYSYNLTRHFSVSSGFDFEQSREEWNKTYEYTGLIVKDTIIDGEPATITYIGTTIEETNQTYRTRSFGFPISVDYSFQLLKRFELQVHLGGVLSGNFVMRNTSILDNIAVNYVDKQASFTFSPRIGTELNYNFSRFGLGLMLNYKMTQIGKINLFEQSISRQNIGFGAHVFYKF
ncbi:MAG: hypothetical protein ACI8ZM_005270 [Crocinitomix sp.]|jgi:hypothetical protein